MIVSFIIVASWGEYDDYTIAPIFICNSEDEAALFTEALNEKDDALWNKIIEYFGNEQYVPKDISFEYRELPLLNIKDI